jgi:hypothetical protein
MPDHVTPPSMLFASHWQLHRACEEDRKPQMEKNSAAGIQDMWSCVTHPRVLAARIGPLQVIIDPDLVDGARLILEVCARRQSGGIRGTV